MRWNTDQPAAWLSNYAPNPTAAFSVTTANGWPQSVPMSSTPQQAANEAAKQLKVHLAALHGLECMWNQVWLEATATPNYVMALLLDVPKQLHRRWMTRRPRYTT